jgi:hypothetical protein
MKTRLMSCYMLDVGRFSFGQEQHLAPARDRADDGPADNVPNA